MAKIQFFTNYNMPAYAGASYEGIPSEATPDQAYTLRDLITQFASGVREFEEIVGNYDEHPDWDEVSPLNNPKFDLVDASIEDLALAEKHIQYMQKKKEQADHLRLLEEQEKARKTAIEEAK